MWRPELRHLIRRLLPSCSQSSPHLTPAVRSLCSSPSSSSDDLALTISTELTNFASSTNQSSSLDLPRHFSLHFSDVRFNIPFLLEILNISPSAGRAAIDFFRWLVRHRGFTANDTSLSHIINYLGRRHDFKAVHDVLLEFRVAAGRESFSAAASIASSVPVALRRPHGFTGHAERAVKRLADVIFPSEQICYTLIRGYSDELKLEDAKRLMGEIIRGGFDLGTPAYNSIIDCVCRLCRKKDPLRLLPEAQKLLLEMESTGIPRDQETFHVLIYICVR
ncbi:hypothetical protein KFK09_005929 [Dendrobium nobile]|uniref:Pentatricopeptide repeat-containing protein n=1 Tax=Dendrobium nobile TaxID=94219 RepID=A0A8T3BX43_DENNO|nr:hypothetical protein KFK09_005929 [Dendrobium nobile]